MFKAVRFYEYGGPEVLKVEEVEAVAPGPGQALVRIEAFGLNRAEIFYRHGWHPITPDFPARIGYEAVGRIESVGEGVTGFKPGDFVGTLPVMDVNPYGAWGQTMTIPVNLLIHNPPELSPSEAAALWSNYMTAYGALVERVKVRPGDTVLLTAASSGVALAGLQILKMLGAKTIAVSRTRDKKAAIEAAGADEVIVSGEEDMVARVNELTGGKGVNLVFDPVGGPDVGKLCDIIQPYGTIVLYGALSPEPMGISSIPMLNKNITITAFAMMLWDQPDRNERSIAFIRDGVARGFLRPPVGREFAIEDMVEAARYLDSMQHFGKVVIRN